MSTPSEAEDWHGGEEGVEVEEGEGSGALVEAEEAGETCTGLQACRGGRVLDGTLTRLEGIGIRTCTFLTEEGRGSDASKGGDLQCQQVMEQVPGEWDR